MGGNVWRGFTSFILRAVRGGDYLSRVRRLSNFGLGRKRIVRDVDEGGRP